MRLALLVVCALLVPQLEGEARAQEPSVSDLTKQLAGSDAAARLKAVDAIAHRGPAAKDAIPALIDALAADDAELRWRAARALAAMGPNATSAVAALSDRLTDPDSRVRAQSANALGEIGPASLAAVPQLGQAITDGDARVRREAMQALEALRPGPDVSIPLLVKVLKDKDPSVVLPALHSLAELGKVAVPVMIEALKNDESRYWATLVLAEIGADAADAVGPLTEVLEDPLPEVRMQAAITLSEIGPPAKSAIPSLTPLLSDKEAAVQHAAAFALGTIDPNASADSLRQALRSDDNFLRLIAAWGLVRHDPTDRRMMELAVGLATEAFKHPDPEIRNVAARLLVELNPPPDIARPALELALQDKDPQVQANIIAAVAAMGPQIVPRLINALEDDTFRETAVLVIARMGPEASQAVMPLVGLFGRTDDPYMKSQIQYALGAIGPDAAPALNMLIGSLGQENNDVRVSACYALAKIGPAAKSAVPALQTLAEDKDFPNQGYAVWALQKLAPDDDQVAKRAVPFLIQGLGSPDALVRHEAAFSLGNIGALAKSAVPTLQAVANDPDPEVRAAVAEALEKIKAGQK